MGGNDPCFANGCHSTIASDNTSSPLDMHEHVSYYLSFVCCPLAWLHVVISHETFVTESGKFCPSYRSRTKHV